MVFDFRLDDRRLYDAMRVMGERGGMLQVHCEDPVLLDAAVTTALQRGDVLPRYHATTRPSYVEAVATARAMAFARMAGAPVHVVHLSSADALRDVRQAKHAGVRASAETCPHYLVLTDERYDDPDLAWCARFIISPTLRTAEDRDALWAAPADRRLDPRGSGAQDSRDGGRPSAVRAVVVRHRFRLPVGRLGGPLPVPSAGCSNGPCCQPDPG